MVSFGISTHFLKKMWQNFIQHHKEKIYLNPQSKQKGKTVSNLGYIRVSSVDQNTARQLDGVILDQIFIDKASGKNTERPQLHSLLEKVSTGDIVYVHSMDRLVRNLQDLLSLVETFNKRGVTVKFKKEAIELRKRIRCPCRCFICWGAVAQFDRRRESLKPRKEVHSKGANK